MNETWQAELAVVTAGLDATRARIIAQLQVSLDRLDHLDGKRLLKGPPMSSERDTHIKVLTGPLMAEHREVARREAHQWTRRLEVETLPADVPLHQRGFGVMDDNGDPG